jgi:hypothetical protein
MRRVFVAATALALVPTILLAASAAPKFRKGTPYATARAELLRRGWSPVKASAPDCEPGREDVCAAYPETQSCAGTGYGLCTFDFRSPSGPLIEIVTHGGSVGQLTVSEVNECPASGCD